MRNWIPASSAAIAMAPPKASTSLTRCPFPIPPIDGLQDICPSVSMLWVTRRVRQPARAAARAASVPAWPPPTTITSNRVGNCIALGKKIDRNQSDFKAIPRRETVFHGRTSSARGRIRSMMEPEVEQAGTFHVKRPRFAQSFHWNYTACQPVKTQLANRVSTRYSQRVKLRGDRNNQNINNILELNLCCDDSDLRSPQARDRPSVSRRAASSRGKRLPSICSNSSCSFNSRFHSPPSTELTRLNFSLPKFSRPFQSKSWKSGTLPMGVSTALPLPWQRSTIHFSTRMFSPYPGQMNFPFASVRNQLMQKMRGRCATERPSLSQWLK